MPNALTVFLKNALVETAAINGGTSFTKGASTITGVFDIVSDNAEALFGGVGSSINCTLLCSTASLGGVTVTKGDIWLYNGGRYRVTGKDIGDSATLIKFVGADD